MKNILHICSFLRALNENFISTALIISLYEQHIAKIINTLIKCDIANMVLLNELINRLNDLLKAVRFLFPYHASILILFCI